MFWYCFRERETILDLFEMSSGQRMHTRYFQVGGVIEDIPHGFATKVQQFCKEMPTRADQYADLLEKNQIVLERLRGTCPLRRGELLRLGVTGPLLRAAGNPWDLRKAAPYSSYDHFDFKIPVGTVGDNYDRYRVRHAEIYESVKIIEQAIDALPEGPYITTDRKVALPPRHELATSMEALIHHFKLVTEGFRVPPGEGYYPIEGPRGELGCFVRSDGSAQARPRAHARPQLHQSAGARADGQGRVPGGHDRDAGDARPDPRRDRPVSAAPAGEPHPRTVDPPLRPRQPRARLGRRGRPDQGARDRPRSGDDRGSAGAASRGSRPRWPSTRTGARPRSRRCTPLRRMHGWCSPEAIDQVAAVMELTPAYLTSVATFYDMLETQPQPLHDDVYVCTNISCSMLGADEFFDAMVRRPSGDDPTIHVARSSASAPATSRRWRRSTASTSAR